LVGEAGDQEVLLDSATSKALQIADTARAVPHWYDFLCPFCYVAQQRNVILSRQGFSVIDLPLRAHPEIPPGGIEVGPRQGPMYAMLAREAEAASLPLKWPDRLPDTRQALAAAEWVRLHQGDAFPKLQKGLFATHFALGEDLGDRKTIERHAHAAGVDIARLGRALEGGEAYRALERSEDAARRYGVHGTPAWLFGDRLVSGLQPREWFEQLAASPETS
jgi:predicted DsbA family dithiol-disulfide isomerase